MNMKLSDGIKLVETAIQKDREEKVYREWLSFYPHMNKPKSFADYLHERLPPQIDYEAQIMSKDDIMAELIGKE